jgi:hypothetical protein
LEANQLEAAAREFRYTIFLKRDFVMGYWQLALVYQRLGEPTQARRNFLQARRAISALPLNSPVEYCDGQSAACLLQKIDLILQGAIA